MFVANGMATTAACHHGLCQRLFRVRRDCAWNRCAGCSLGDGSAPPSSARHLRRNSHRHASHATAAAPALRRVQETRAGDAHQTRDATRVTCSTRRSRDRRDATRLLRGLPKRANSAVAKVARVSFSSSPTPDHLLPRCRHASHGQKDACVHPIPAGTLLAPWQPCSARVSPGALYWASAPIKPQANRNLPLPLDANSHKHKTSPRPTPRQIQNVLEPLQVPPTMARIKRTSLPSRARSSVRPQVGPAI